MLRALKQLLFPAKCTFCRRLLGRDELDLCAKCRRDAPEFISPKKKISFIAGWTAVWYYKDTVRSSILRYKFYNRRSYAGTYGRAVAMRITETDMRDFDVLTWVPISRRRSAERGYDQVRLLALSVGKELGTQPVRALKKIRDNPPQSALPSVYSRRANVLDAYRVTDAESIRGKRVLLLDDVITTGSTVSECARTLLSAGAKEVRCAAIATVSD